MPKITYEYILPDKNGNPMIGKPLMSEALEVLFEQIFDSDKAEQVHIVHAGTVGDDRHRLENPNSYHLHHPPDAIDVVKIFVKHSMSPALDETWIFKKSNPFWERARIEFSKIIGRFGGRTYHATDKEKNHLHIQVKP
jgi:hypothetical protein